MTRTPNGLERESDVTVTMSGTPAGEQHKRHVTMTTNRSSPGRASDGSRSRSRSTASPSGKEPSRPSSLFVLSQIGNSVEGPRLPNLNNDNNNNNDNHDCDHKVHSSEQKDSIDSITTTTSTTSPSCPPSLATTAANTMNNTIKDGSVDGEVKPFKELPTPELTETSFSSAQSNRIGSVPKSTTHSHANAHDSIPIGVVVETPISLTTLHNNVTTVSSSTMPFMDKTATVHPDAEQKHGKCSNDDGDNDDNEGFANDGPTKSCAVGSDIDNEPNKSSTHHNNDTVESSSDESSDETSTDEEEIMRWAQKMFGVAPPPLRRAVDEVLRQQEAKDMADSDDNDSDDEEMEWTEPTMVEAEPSFRRKPFTKPKQPKRSKKKKTTTATAAATGVSKRPSSTTTTSTTTIPSKSSSSSKTSSLRKSSSKASSSKREARVMEASRLAKKRREEARTPTVAELKAILGDDFASESSSHANFVRRSVRQPCKSVLDSPKLRSLTDKLRGNDSDMVVLKMKQHINDPNTPTVVLDAVLAALEDNTNCQALYIQNFNEAMRDEQVLHLLRILQLPHCHIWCLNIGETYNVKMKTWRIFARGLKRTKITHMYASEHTITPKLKDTMRNNIRANRSKHRMHIDPTNLDVIVRCTHCWWNPMRAKALLPYLQKSGYEQILHDREAQGLKGTMSASQHL